jgi:hypothetical protein
MLVMQHNAATAASNARLARLSVEHRRLQSYLEEALVHLASKRLASLDAVEAFERVLHEARTTSRASAERTAELEWELSMLKEAMHE